MRNIGWGRSIMLAAALTVGSTVAADRPVHEIQVTASRYAFDPATIQVTAGEPVRIVIRSTDGAHGFSIPKLKIDVPVPKNGVPATAEFTAPAAGRYEIACSEFCGSGHGRMKAALVSVGPTQTSR
jgi:cytochrome c oxidase subunit 2